MKKISLPTIAIVITIASNSAFAADNFAPNSFGDFVAQKLSEKK